ncbi:MAG TPA: formyltransferase [Usitatibacter sp.]|jgi:methionyl-tRNA formyltransferase|nr:formyltransferase [Usitatibacter sp.]
MNAVVFAYHDVGVRCLSVLLAHGVDVALVVTHKDDPGEDVWFGSVEKLARARDIEVATPADPNIGEFVERLQSISPDFIFSFYYRFMLSPEVLATAMVGAYNMHGSLLPKYRGRVPVNWAVLRGERTTGATLHEMVEKPDAGRIVDQMAVPILPDDRAVDVFRKVTVAAEVVLDRSLPALLDGTAALTVQDLSRGGYFRGRKTDDGRIDWTKGAREIHDLVRAVAPPYPGAFTLLDGARVRILATRVLDERAAEAPPRLAVQGSYLVAECADGGRLRIIDWDVDGAAMDAPSFAARFGAQPSLHGETS